MDNCNIELSSYINTTGTGNGINFLSYFTNGKIKGIITHTRVSDFLSKYCTLASEDDNNDGDGLFIAEQVQSNKTPLIVNFNFKFHIDEDNDEPNLYDTSFLELVCHCIQSSQVELLQINANFQECICVVQETKTYQSNHELKINIRFQFPYCNIDHNFYTKTLKPLIIKKLRSKKVIKKLDESPIGDWEVILTDISDYLPLYRSRGLDNSPPYQVSHIYHFITDEQITEELEIKEFELKDVFQPSSHTWIHNRLISTDFLNTNVQLEYWLPLFLSCSFY
jgi:hypothetical protein